MARTKSNSSARPCPIPPPIQGPSSDLNPVLVQDELVNKELDQTRSGSPSVYLNMDQFKLETAVDDAQGMLEDEAPDGQIDPDTDVPEGEMFGEERSG